jgi:hypothetical protein
VVTTEQEDVSVTNDLEARQEAEWQILRDRITEILDNFGRKKPVRKGDYWLLDDNWGTWHQEVEVQNLSLLKPPIVKMLHALLAAYPDWEITVRVDVVGKENIWPAMGLIIHDHEIIDDLQREFLPEEFRSIVYEGSKHLADTSYGFP